jgi:type VI protein secretion system component VasK
VLKNGVMQDVLSLTASGSPDIPLGSLSIALTDGLQTQLNAKATTAALSAAAESLGAELDSVEAQVSALGDTLAAVGAAVDTKATTASVNAVLTSLNNQYNTVSSLLGTRASQSAVTAALALKQDLIVDGSLPVATIEGLQDTLD